MFCLLSVEQLSPPLDEELELIGGDYVHGGSGKAWHHVELNLHLQSLETPTATPSFSSQMQLPSPQSPSMRVFKPANKLFNGLNFHIIEPVETFTVKISRLLCIHKVFPYTHGINFELLNFLFQGKIYSTHFSSHTTENSQKELFLLLTKHSHST